MSSTSDRRDPKPDVVTGYPATTTSSAPASGNVYPNPAPPPHAAPYYPNTNQNGYYANPNGYYPNPNPNYNPYYSNPNPSYNRNFFLRRLLAVAVAAFLFAGVVTFIVWLIIRPKLPDFSVSSFAVSNFNLSSSDSLSSDFNFNLTVRNPNKKMSISYDQAAAAVLYDNNLIAETTLSPFFQKTGDVTNINAKLVATGSYVGADVVSAIRYEKGKGDGVVNFDIRFISVVKFKAGAWRARNRVLRVYCDDIGVGFKNTTAGAGSMVGSARRCQVGHPSFTPRPEMPAMSGTTGLPVASNSSAIQPTTADFSPSPLRAIVPSPAAPSSLAAVSMAHLQNIQQQIYSPYPSMPPMAPTPQAPWLHPPLAGGLPHAPFFPYPGVLPPLFTLPMRGTSVPSVHTPNVQLPGVPTAIHRDTSSIAESNSVSKLTADHEKEANDLHKEGGTAMREEADAWTAHKMSGTIYYYNSITGESTYDRPSSFKGEPEKVAEQPTPLTWEKIAGTDWTLITTNDGKKYYYDTKNKVSSWQVPAEVTEMRKNQENDSLKANTAEEENSGSIAEKASAPINMSSPAVHTCGRDSMVVRSSGGQVSSSALDLIKKKLQEAGTPVTSTPLSPSTVSTTSELNGSRAADTVNVNSKDKVKDANEGNMSVSSSDSDDAESGPSKEECIIQFKEMLKERGVAPFAKWDKELPKIVFDPRFKAVPSYSARRSIFEHFVRTRAEEERKEKKAAQKAAIDGFKQLLEEASEDIDHKTDYQTFKKKWGKDPRFEALDRKEREVLLNEKVLPLKKAAEEKNQAIRSATVTGFKLMLRENKDITVSSRWSKVKDILRSDPRYKSVKHEERDILFNEYISELKAAQDEAERAAKAKKNEHDKLKEREREMRKRKEREEQEMERIRVKVRRKESISSYQALLVETIKDPKASWTESKPKLEKDPQHRATNPDLSEADMEKLFRDHVKDLFERCARDYRSLLSEVITMEVATKATDDGKNALNSWTEAKRLLKSDSRYTKLPRKERESLWSRYTDDMIRKQKAAADPKERSEKEGRDKSSADFPRRSPRRSHGRR